MTVASGLMGRLFGRLLGSGQPDGVALLPLDLADGPVYAIGDVHGCRNLLRALEAQIAADAAQFEGRPRVILLGDLVDRGPNTAGVLDDVMRPLRWGDRLALRGNHEDMMLAFVDDPRANLDWLGFGGFETLGSYGLVLDEAQAKQLPTRRLQQMLSAHLPDDHLAWLRNLPPGFVVRGLNQAFVLAHAGFDPTRGPHDQPLRTLTWGGMGPGPEHGLRLVHGHVIQQAPDLAASCIGIDTGAYKSGKLTALRLAESYFPHVLTVDAVPS